jgi:hypothetical protein
MALSPLSLLPMLLLPLLPTVMTKFSFRMSHTVLIWFCVMVMLNLPCRLAAVADALLGMVNSDLLLLLLLLQWLPTLVRGDVWAVGPTGDKALAFARR